MSRRTDTFCFMRIPQTVRIYLLIALIATVGAADLYGAKRLKLYLLDFDNIRNDETVSWLSRGLVDMVSTGFQDVDGVRVHDRVALERILQDRSLLLSQPSGTRSILVMGSFTRELDQLTVNIQLINIANWVELGSFVTRGSLNQVSKLGEDLVLRMKIALEGEIPQPDARGILKSPDAKAPIPEYRQQAKELNFSLETAVEDLEKVMDLYIGSRDELDPTVSEGSTFSREFSFSPGGIVEDVPTKDAVMLEEIINTVSSNPYIVDISRPSLHVPSENDGTVLFALSVKYSLRENVIKDMLSSLPYSAMRQDGSLISLQFSRREMRIPHALIERISRGDFRIVPVIQLMDKEGRARTIILETSEPSWYRRTSSNVRFLTEHQFSPLIAFTASGNSLQVTMETVEINAEYMISLSRHEAVDYTKVLIEFIPESELESFLGKLL
ncbi:MAG: hypothetical protein ACE5EE_10360 [Fidelibacterota bacterium]